MVTSSCGTLAVGSDQPASDQGHPPGRWGDCEGLRVVGRQSARRAGAVRQEIVRVFRLIALQPGVGARAKNARLPGVRRVHLSRVHYHLYYRVRSDPAAVEILAFWHTSRGTSPRV